MLIEINALPLAKLLNPLKWSGVRQLHLIVFSAIQV